jgi:hypothetical protein
LAAASGDYLVAPRFSRTRAAAVAAWRRVPLGVTAYVGERVYRRL